MITKDNFREVLTVLGFSTSDNSLFIKKYDSCGIELAVNFSSEKLIYPSIIKGGERNDSFDQKENFVVFECVNRLLEKGYRPEHIELEKQWPLGHDTKGGRGDICISALDGTMLAIIECKTFGHEYEKYKQVLIDDGGQLFSYWQQEQSCKWLILYASELKDNCIIIDTATIDCSDDVNVIQTAKKDKSIKLFRDAHTAPEKHSAWKETYICRMHGDLFFSSDSVAYRIGVKPLLKKNLKDFTPDDKIVNKFEEILRHNNVSDKENAFNRLIALFICKLVDEITKSENDEVEFQYKQGTDTYETLQDRLQRLHRDGMEKFMREEIYYISADYPERLFSTYTGSKRKKAIEDLQNTIRILKFYSNNDFAFKDVHNEELFYQNGRILVEMVQLFEKYRIVYPSKHQFLGDLFEQLLNKGFKQNEGQFFTPMPITRFIWDSLPVDRMVKSDRGTVYPKVIDYACGAGHFLTEAIEAINFFVHSDDDNAWAKDHIYGIEKDYRLARVAKISLFMNGAGEGNIIFGDGLENAPDKGIENGAFDILVANPPYSVKDFKQHLQLKNNEFSLLDRIGINSGEIETLFVERIGQLLKPKGIAAVILPSSILSNDSASYIGAREQILQNFYIRGIAAFGSKTFGATGTNTVVLFLEKFDEPPKQVDLSSDSVDAILSNSPLEDWKDQEIFEAYLAQIEMDEDKYRAYLHKDLQLDELYGIEYFQMYVSSFADSSEAKNLQKTKTFQNKSESEKKEAYLDKFYAYSFAIEREKLFYFSLVYRQTTVIITSPTDNKEQKDFLGYDWSNRKGNEGIQIITPGGKMYDESNRVSEHTLASAIRQSFASIVPELDSDQKTYGSVVNTKDMLDFSRSRFIKAIRINANKVTVFTSKYPLEAIGNILSLEYGRSLTESERQEGPYPVMGSSGRVGNHSEYYVEGPSIIVGRKGSAGLLTWENENCFPIDTTYYVKLKSTDYLLKYLYYVMRQIDFKVLTDNMGVPGLNRENVYQVKIPKPPKEIQERIIEECGRIDEEYHSIRMSIEEYKNKIAALFDELDVIALGGGRLSLANADKFDICIGKRVLDKQLIVNGPIPVFSANVVEPFGYIDELLITDFSVPSVLWGIDGDWMTSFVPANKQFYPTDHCGVIRCKTEEIDPVYLAHVLEREGKNMGFSRSYRASIDRIKGISFSVPSKEKQKDTINRIHAIEMKIKELIGKIEDLSGKITESLNSYLQ